MSSRFAPRSKEAPMDFEYTNRANVRPSWASPGPPSMNADDFDNPRKRSRNEMGMSIPAFPSTPPRPSFGQNTNIPFLFQSPPTHSEPSHPWAPPTNFSPERAFPAPTRPAPDMRDMRDIDMAELSPPKALTPPPPRENREGGNDENKEIQETDKEKERESKGWDLSIRPVAIGGLKRVFKQRERERSRLAATRRRPESDVGSDSESGEDGDEPLPLAQNLSNHYTLNMPSPAPPQTDTPYILLGYLQFFFNLSLVLVFLYLLVQFILTVQRDVEERITEYSMDIVQEIAACQAHYVNNQCGTNPIPAMLRQCGSWETCMNRDPTVVGRARVGAEMIAEVVNGFVEPISWKTLAFTLTSLSFLTVFVNTLLSLYRRNQLAAHQPAPTPTPAALAHQPSFALPPGSPFPHPHAGYLSPAPVQAGWQRAQWTAAAGEPQTPTRNRRRRLDGGVAARVE